jgi:hypothetical protein
MMFYNDHDDSNGDAGHDSLALAALTAAWSGLPCQAKCE